MTLAGLILLSTAGCKSLESGARETFVANRSCPEDRVEVIPREDLTAHQVLHGRSVAAPAEIQSDPERLRLWQERQDSSNERTDDRFEVFQVRGCGHDDLLACAHPSIDRTGRGLELSRVMCTPGKDPAVRQADSPQGRIDDARKAVIDPATPDCDARLLDRVLLGKAGRVRACFARGADSQANTAGTMHIEWSFDASGRPQVTRLAEESIGQLEVLVCLLDTAERLHVPVRSACKATYAFGRAVESRPTRTPRRRPAVGVAAP